MSQHHDLMESVTLVDEASPITTASPPRRVSMEDADSSLTRKRPRLDNGTASKRAMPADHCPTENTNPHPPADQLVEMTIRSQPRSSPQPAADTDDTDLAVDTPPSPDPPAAMATADAAEQGTPPVMDTTETQRLDDSCAPSDSPPVISLVDDDDDDAEEVMDDYTGSYIHIEQDEGDYFRKFPFAHSHAGDYRAALAAIIQHFHGANPLDGTVLPLISVWLERFPDLPSQWKGYYHDQSQFWDEFAIFVNKVLVRRYPFGDSFCDDSQTEDEIFYAFFSNYVALCARLLQVDASMLSRSTEHSFSEHELLSYKHLKHLYTILRPEKSPVFALLKQEYTADIREMGHRLINDFIEPPTDGARHLFAFTDAACDRVTTTAKNIIAIWATQIWSILGWTLFDLNHLELIDRSKLYHDILHYFRRYNVDLQDPGKVVDVGVAKDLLIHFATLLMELCQWDNAIASELAQDLLPFGSPSMLASPSGDDESSSPNISFNDDLTNRPALVANAWKFKLLRKYVVKGRMELRVMSIGTMDGALVDIWREYNTSTHGTHHPVMQYLADFLLHEQVIDYIISVDSHPQLISRSGNIIGFLVVTHRYSESQTDAIWHTISNSQDPRVVSATLTMLRSITALMDAPELQYLCTKLYSLPIESYSLDILRFLSDISEKLRSKPSEWSGTTHTARPWNVCIRVMQDTPPSRASTKLTVTLHHEACNQLGFTCANIGTEERQQIFTECAKHIASRSPKATGSIRAINMLLSREDPSYSDVNFFRKRPEITRHILEELCWFVRTENQQGPYQCYTEALDYRLEVLRFLVVHVTETVPTDLYLDIWDHVIGKHALNNQIRDRAWPKLTEVVRKQPGNEFCKQLISDYVPALEPEYFTPGMYEFVATYDFPTTRELVATSDGNKELLQIRGATLLWRMVLTAPQGTIEDRAAKLLASRYVEVDTDQGVTLEEVEDAHVALVQKCTEELLTAYKTLRGCATADGSADSGENMDIVLSDSAQQQTELRFSRTILFEKLLLATIRKRPLFNHARRSDPKVEIPEPEITYGDTIEIKYTSPSTMERETLFIGTENTLQDLETRICNATGCTKVNLFHSGQRLTAKDKTQMQLSGFRLAPSAHILVQRAAGSDMCQPVSDSRAGCSVFETTVLEHFEELFACMDSNDRVSGELFDFLSSLPFQERITDDVTSGKASTDRLFPPGKPFQAKYAACALQHKLKEQLRRSTLDETFLLNAIQVLDKAILNPDLLSASLSGPLELHLAAVLVTVLLEFLEERPQQEVSSRYFSDGTLLVDRLMSIIHVALKAEYDGSSVVWQSYATILKASLHSRAVWEAFVNRAEISDLHGLLLLRDPRKHLRESIVKSIASVCAGDLPQTSPVTRVETAARFWTIITAVLPDTVRYASQSEQLFEIAELVFRSHDENTRDEETLRSCLSSWSELLLHYKHEEFVGRDDVDFVVLGFAKLLLSCILSIKSFKKPLNAGQLMEQIFRKFLFIPKVMEIHDDDSRAPDLPVLESSTRKELYDLVLALAEDRASYGTLLNLAESLVSDEESMSLLAYSVDRSNEIRSSTGYVGLLNPRAICYMNSLVTQLFMNVNFRKFMLGLNVADSAASQRLLSETQTLFATMQNSFRKSADPRQFAQCVKGVEGLPIDVNIQMDADEFYNLLFDQWEGQMLSPETKQRFRSFYGGKTVNQIKSKECEHVSERVESFFVVQCDVQGKANLQESLQAFVEGDVMEGDNKYKCESCGGKFVDAVKRTCLKEVGDNLIFHLKRFDFDLVDMRRAKINDYFAFPDQIDVSLYSVDHLSDPSKPRQQDIFELVGVLVHQGTSENGHYYSYIRERPCASGSMSQWVEFNDRDVDPFDHQTIPYHAFGGWYDDQFPGQQKQFSAYMLFYQRKTAIVKDHDEYISSPHGGAVKVPVPPILETAINADNEAFVREYSLHDPNHSKFVRQILSTLRTVNHGTCSEDHQQETQALHTALEHICQTISHQRNIEYFDESMIQLRKTVLSCPNCCQIGLRWLATQESALTGLLLRCPHMKVRSQVRAFLADNLRYLRDKDPAVYFGFENTDVDMESGLNAAPQSVLVDIVQRLRAVADECWISARGWDDLYLTLCQLSRMGHRETAVLLNHGILEFCLKILSMHASHNYRLADPDLWRLVEKKKTIFNRLIELVYVLLSNVDIRLPPVEGSSQAIDRWEYYDRTHEKFPLSHIEHDCLTLWDGQNRACAVLDRMIELFDSTKTETFYPGEVLKLMLQSRDNRIQRLLYFTLTEGITTVQAPFSDPYLRAALYFCETCPDIQFLYPVMDAVVASAIKLRENGGEAHIDFFNSLLVIQNEALFAERSPEFFQDYALSKCRMYAIPLLLYDDEAVRKATATHLDRLFGQVRSDESAIGEFRRIKYNSMRRLVIDMIKRIVHEHDNGSSRSYMQPMIGACHALVQHLSSLMNTNDPALMVYKHVGDANLLASYEKDVEPRLRNWLPEESTPISTGEAYEQSDYGSDSDDGVEVEN